MPDTHADAVRWLEGQRDAMLALVAELVNLDSGSFDKPGVDAVGTRIAAFLPGHGIPVETVPVEGHGDALKAHVAGPGGSAVAGEFSGGCTDSGFTASVGCPTLCAVGGKAHSPDDYLEVDSLVPRAAAETIAAVAAR